MHFKTKEEDVFVYDRSIKYMNNEIMNVEANLKANIATQRLKLMTRAT